MCNNARSLGTVTDEMLSFKTHCGIFVCKGILKLSFLFGISLDSLFRQGKFYCYLIRVICSFIISFISATCFLLYYCLDIILYRSSSNSALDIKFLLIRLTPGPSRFANLFHITCDVGLMSKAICSSSSPVSILQMYPRYLRFCLYDCTWSVSKEASVCFCLCLSVKKSQVFLYIFELFL